jgi:hypothetical protein
VRFAAPDAVLATDKGLGRIPDGCEKPMTINGLLTGF